MAFFPKILRFFWFFLKKGAKKMKIAAYSHTPFTFSPQKMH